MPSRALGAALAVLSIIASACATSAPSTAGPSPVQTTLSTGGPGQAAASPPACPETPALDPAVPWWQGRVFYEVFVRSFADSDGDGIGDLRGLIDHLDQLNDGDPATHDDLGISGLWLMPIAESPSYHGYDVVDYRAVERDYGTIADFRALIAAAHERGIAIVLDFVINHTSREHPWFRDARKRGSAHKDWYVWSETRPAVAGPGGARVWHPDGDRFYYAYFWEGMPDLNLENPDVTAELDGIAGFWLDLGVDGFRLDATRHLIEEGKALQNTPATFEWLAGFRERIHERRPEALVLGEVWDATSMSSRYVRDGSLDMTFDFGLAGATITSLRSGDAGSLRAAEQEVSTAYPPGGLATFLTNHDQDRVASQLDRDLASARLAGMLLLTGGGTPFVYYGEEIGLTGRKPDERIRPPMRWDATTPGAGFTTGTPWEPFGDDPTGTDTATESADPASLLSTYRNLIGLRGDHPALAVGDWTPVDADPESVVAYVRDTQTETVLVVANLADEAVASPSLGLDEGHLCGALTASTLATVGVGDEAAVAAPVVNGSGGFGDYRPLPGLPARSGYVIELRPNR